MIKKINFLTIIALTITVSLPVMIHAQQVDREDPFKRDPFFTKSLEDMFGLDSEEGDIEEVDDSVEADRAVRRLSRRGVDFGGSFSAGPYYSSALYSQYPNLNMWHFNRVNGLFMGIGKERMQWHRRGNFLYIPQIEPHGFIGWGTASKRWEYAIGAEKMIGASNRFMIGGEFHKATGTEDYERVGLTETSITSFMAGYDFLDYHLAEGFGFYALYRTSRWLEAGFSYNRDTFSTLNQTTAFSIFGKSANYSPNPPIDRNSNEIDLDIYSVSIALNPRKVLISNHFTISGKVMMELADNKQSDQDYRFNKYQADASLYYNFEPGSVLRWRVQSASIVGFAPDFKQIYLGGIGTLRGSPYKFFSGNRMLASNLEVQFGRPSSRAGEWIRDYNLHLLLFLDSGWVQNFTDLEESGGIFDGFSSMSFSDFQHDAGIGLGSGSLRFEMAWPLKTFDSTPTLWVRFNPTF